MMRRELETRLFYTPGDVKSRLNLAALLFKERLYYDSIQQYIYILKTSLNKKARYISRRNLWHYINTLRIPVSWKNTFDPILKFPLTMTTCKRYNIFKRTIRSFFTMVDYQCVSKIFIVDDNSLEEEVKQMHEDLDMFQIEYEIIEKTENQKGHAQSMNIIIDLMKKSGVQFFIHLEDDFEFFIQAPIISQCVEVLLENPEYGQCLFNNSYSEERQDFAKPSNGRLRTTRSNSVFFEHVHGDISPHGYWPGFSLRPGLNRTSMFEHLGYFIETGSFEKDYAVRALNFGWKFAYLEAAYCEHIGRKTSERHDSTKDNAYTLNKSQQWGGTVIHEQPFSFEGIVQRAQELLDNYKTVQAYFFIQEGTQQKIPICIEGFEPWDIVFMKQISDKGNVDYLVKSATPPEKFESFILRYTGARKILENWNECARDLRDVFSLEGLNLYIKYYF